MVVARFSTFDDTLSPEVARMLRATEDLSPAMVAIAQYGLSETQQRFEDQRGPDGQAWAPSQAAREKGRPTLIDTTRLLSSLTSASDMNSAEWGTNVVYAAIHNEGGTIRARSRADGGAGALKTPFGPRASVEMPKRQFIGFSKDDPEEIKNILLDFILGGAA